MIVSIPCNGGTLEIVEGNLEDGTNFEITFQDLGMTDKMGSYGKLGDALRRIGEIFEEMTGGRY